MSRAWPASQAKVSVRDSQVVLFRTWGGDGAFPSFFGYRADGEVVCLVTDMFLCFDHVLGSAEA
jgi:hypothetical protein